MHSRRHRSLRRRSRFLGFPRLQQPAPPSFNPDNVAPNAAVVTIQGVCPKDTASAKTGAVKSDSCQTVITKEQFNSMLSGMNLAAQISNPAAMRSFAESYAQLLALAGEGEKAGAENDPRFQELMRIARIRALADLIVIPLKKSTATRHRKKLRPTTRKISPNTIPSKLSASSSLQSTTIARPPRAPSTKRNSSRWPMTFVSGQPGVKKHKSFRMKSIKLSLFPLLPKTDLGMKRRGGLPAGIEKDLLALKPGEVTKLENEMSGMNIYKLRSRDTIPLEFVKAEIVRDLHQKNMEAALKAVTGNIHPELNEQFFGPIGRTGGPSLRNPQSSDASSPKPITPGTPNARPVNWQIRRNSLLRQNRKLAAI